jgi:hypothetical protein
MDIPVEERGEDPAVQASNVQPVNKLASLLQVNATPYVC